ncbi:MAG: ATP-binding protein [Methylomonas sp.]
MSKNLITSDECETLRATAEHKLLSQSAQDRDDNANEIKLRHELQIHQIELEMQNEALQQARDAERISLARYTELFDFAPIAYFDLGLDGLIRCANFCGARLLGHDRINLVDRHLSNFVRAQDRPAFTAFLHNVLFDEEPNTCEVCFEIADSILWVRIQGALDCQQHSYLLAVMDINEQKRAKMALLEADRRKDEFLAMLAHELRNPLAPIQNAAQLLKMHATTDAKLTWCHEVIDRQVTHMTKLLDDLLDVARIMLGKVRLKTERVDLNEMIDNAVEASRPLIESRQQVLTIAQAKTPQWLEGDRIRLVQVLSNLLNNAAKYTGEGGHISLSAKTAGSDAVIEVQDSGIGIAPEILPQIFDLFTQADHSLAHSQGGLGIGLTLVRQLVELHGGKVTAESAGMGQGSLFTVRLPGLLEDETATQSAPSEPMLPPHKLRILVVDDYADSAFSMMMLLQTEGHEVETAHCGLEALERAQIFQPQVVLLDIGLPDLDGYEGAKRLRALPETREAILIALTGYGQEEDRQRSQAAGCNHHLLKPLRFSELSALMAKLSL